MRSPWTSEDAAARKSTEQRGADAAAVDASLCAQRERFADRAERTRDDHLIADFTVGPTQRADVNDPFGLPIASDPAAPLEQAASPTMIDNDALIAPISPPLTGASRHDRAELDSTRRKPPRHGRRNRAGIDQKRPWLESAEHASGPFENSLHVGRVGHHRDDAAG